jgi:hypothetical protein
MELLRERYWEMSEGGDKWGKAMMMIELVIGNIEFFYKMMEIVLDRDTK